MSIETQLVARLKANANLVALVVDRIYPLTAPQNVVKPYITYQIINELGMQCMSGNTYQEDVRVQIDCWSLSYGQVISIKDEVKSSIALWKASSEVSTMDGYENDTKLFRKLIDFNIKE